MLRSLPRGSLLIVQGEADTERRYKCRFCDKTFKTGSHKRIHEGVHLLPHQCRFCNRRFSIKCTMKIHERTHTGIKPFKCSVCAETFRERRACKNHLWKVHKGNGEVIEDSKLEQESNLNLVESKIEPTLGKNKAAPNSKDAQTPFKCRTCLKGFATGRSLSLHERIHRKPFSCETCGAMFSHKCVLETHRRTHTGERPYLCSICFRAFSLHAACKLHQRNVHKILNGDVINTKVYGVKVVTENALPNENQNATPENQSEHKIQEPENLQGTNGDGENFICSDTKQEVQINLNEGGRRSCGHKTFGSVGRCLAFVEFKIHEVLGRFILVNNNVQTKEDNICN